MTTKGNPKNVALINGKKYRYINPNDGKPDCTTTTLKSITYVAPSAVVTNEQVGCGNHQFVTGDTTGGKTCKTFFTLETGKIIPGLTPTTTAVPYLTQCIPTTLPVAPKLGGTPVQAKKGTTNCMANFNGGSDVTLCPGTTTTTTAGPKGPSTTTTMSAWDHHQTLYILLIILAVCSCFGLAYFN